MITRVDGEVETESESEDDQMPPLKDACDNDVEYSVEGESLVVRHALSVQVVGDEMEQQRENIFHTRCHIKNKVCHMIIDGGSCTNVASITLVEKLNLSTLKHPRPYKLLMTRFLCRYQIANYQKNVYKMNFYAIYFKF